MVEFEQQWNAYFVRFLIVIWFLIFPCTSGGLFLFFKEMNKSKNIVVVFPMFKGFRPYEYVIHNFCFVLFSASLIFNQLFFIGVFVDAYLLELDNLYEWFWKVESAEEERKFFLLIVALGYFLSLITMVPYLYCNLYRTDSYFGEKWRKYVIEKLRTKAFWKKIRDKSPVVYDLIYRAFLNVNFIVKKEETRKIIVIDN